MSSGEPNPLPPSFSKVRPKPATALFTPATFSISSTLERGRYPSPPPNSEEPSGTTDILLVNQERAPLTCWVRRAERPPSTVRAKMPTTMPKTVRKVRALRLHMLRTIYLINLLEPPFSNPP